MTQDPKEWCIAQMANRQPSIEVDTLRPVALKPYQKAMFDWLQDSTSTKQVTLMRTDVGRTPLLFTAEEMEIFGLSVVGGPLLQHSHDLWRCGMITLTLTGEEAALLAVEMNTLVERMEDDLESWGMYRVPEADPSRPHIEEMRRVNQANREGFLGEIALMKAVSERLQAAAGPA